MSIDSSPGLIVFRYMMSAEPDWGDDDSDGGGNETPKRIRGIGREKRAEAADPATRKTSKVERTSPDASVMHSNNRKLVSRPSQIGSSVDASPTNDVPRPPTRDDAKSHNPGELHRAATAHKGTCYRSILRVILSGARFTLTAIYSQVQITAGKSLLISIRSTIPLAPLT